MSLQELAKADHPSITPLSLKVNGMVAQIEGIMPRKLLINKSNELYFTSWCNKKTVIHNMAERVSMDNGSKDRTKFLKRSLTQ